MIFLKRTLSVAVLCALSAAASANDYQFTSGTHTIEGLNLNQTWEDSGVQSAVRVSGTGTVVNVSGDISVGASFDKTFTDNSGRTYSEIGGVEIATVSGNTEKAYLNLGDESTKLISIDVDVRGTGYYGSGAPNNGFPGHMATGITSIGASNAVGPEIVVTSDVLRVNVHSEEGPAYGVQVQNNTPTAEGDFATLIINAKDTYVTVTSGDGEAASSSGLVAMSQGQLFVNGNLYVKADSAIVARGGAVVRINKDNKNIVQLDGDICFDYDAKTSGTAVDADVVVNLSGENSYWNGSAIYSYGTGKPSDEEKLVVDNLAVGLSNGAQWNPTIVEGDSSDQTSGEGQLAINQLEMNDGVINLKTPGQSVQIQEMEGTGGTINIAAQQSDSGEFQTASIVIDTVQNASDATPSLAVNFTGITADNIENPEEDIKALADSGVRLGADQKVNQVRTVSEGNIRGALTQTLDETGNVVTEQAENVKLSDYSSVNAMTLVQWRNEINHLTKRLGDVRASSSAIGAWARVYGGESQWGDSSEVEMKHTSIQVGGDYRISDQWLAGAAFSYTNSDADLAKGQAEGDSYSLAAYATYTVAGGSYLDLIARYGYLDNDINTGNMKLDTQSNAFSLTVETGHQFRFMERAYVEPQIELTYGFVSGDDSVASNGVRIEQDDYQSFIARIGVRSGFDLPGNAGTVYGMFSYSYDFLGDADGMASQGELRQALNEDLGGGWVTYGIGAQFRLGNSAYAYGELERTSGGKIDNPYSFNAGIRFVF